MRLFLSSYRFGNQPEQLTELLDDNRRTAVVSNAIDWRTPEERQERLDQELLTLGTLGLEPEELDLRTYFKKPKKDLAQHLGKFGLVWLSGGNTFLLNRAMHQSGFSTVIKKLLADDSIVYGGYSAGACVAAPTLHGLELCDDIAVTAAGYNRVPVWEGLDLVPYSIAPHYQSDYHKTELIDQVVDYFAQHSMPYKALRDGEVIIVDER